MEMDVIVITSFSLTLCSYRAFPSPHIDSQLFIFEDNKLFLMKR